MEAIEMDVFIQVHHWGIEQRALPWRWPQCSGRLVNRRFKPRCLQTTLQGTQDVPGGLILVETDPEIAKIIQLEKCCQVKASLILLKTENFTLKAVMTAEVHVRNKYSEARPSAQYYRGNEYIDHCNLLCEKRALELFGLDFSEWVSMFWRL